MNNQDNIFFGIRVPFVKQQGQLNNNMNNILLGIRILFLNANYADFHGLN